MPPQNPTQQLLSDIQAHLASELAPQTFVDSTFMEKFYTTVTYTGALAIPQIDIYNQGPVSFDAATNGFISGWLQNHQSIPVLSDYIVEFTNDFTVFANNTVNTAAAYNAATVASTFEAWIGTPGAYNYMITGPNSLNLFTVISTRLDWIAVTGPHQIPKSVWELAILFETWKNNTTTITGIQTIIDTYPPTGLIAPSVPHVPCHREYSLNEWIISILGHKFAPVVV